MPRHPVHPGSPYTIPVIVKLNPELVRILDLMRGTTARSVYLRDLLRSAASEPEDETMDHGQPA